MCTTHAAPTRGKRVQVIAEALPNRDLIGLIATQKKERTDQTERFYRAGTYEVIEFGYNGKGLNNKYVMGKTPQMTTPLLL